MRWMLVVVVVFRCLPLPCGFVCKCLLMSHAIFSLSQPDSVRKLLLYTTETVPDDEIDEKRRYKYVHSPWSKAC